MNEEAAIRLCLKHHDPIGFEFLVKKYRREALYHARIFMKDQEDAADACQESFTKAFMAMPRMSQLDNFYPWFYRILKNCCLNMISRQNTVRKYQTLKKQVKDNGVIYENPHNLLEKTEEKKQVWQAIDALSVDFREILVMKYIQGLCYEEIANILAIPRGTVMSRLYHARIKFKAEFENINRSEKE